ncbi:porin [Synechococcus sp. RSCCF101]|uniref:iron uptake porin n=1 Tax=Synechococcus sp. RSCCF101 TaxID=2511069 RepID=UPI001244BACD|nr:iron uptake porin [Synechococcus sp. RSCCF101]QEY32903.1 porin [Synechococcus sp. RSCCF101]
MKLFQRLLVAPAALGLLAPVAAGLPSAASAGELNLDGVSAYSVDEEDLEYDQVTSISQFSDVYPTDWAYQALSNLIERYGCVAGYPDGTYRGGRAMTRFEAAALLNACLDRITEVTDELKRLMKEFEKELAILKGRVDGLEARVGELEATQFSTTTVLKGKNTFVMGAVNGSGDNPDGTLDSYLLAGGRQEELFPAVGSDEYNAEEGAFTFSYDARIELKTSFTGKDLLFTRLRANNFDNAFNGDGLAGNLTKLDIADDTSNTVKINRLYYKFPLGDSFTAIVGPVARNTESLAMKPSVYGKKGDKILDFFGGTWGTPGVYNKETGGLIGAYWKQKVDKGDPAFSVSVNYVADSGEASDGNPNTGGFMTDNSEGNILAQLGYGNKQWGLALGYRYGQCQAKFRNGTDFVAANSFWQDCEKITDITVDADGNFDGFERGGRSDADSHSFAVNAYWQPKEAGWIPSISVGWAISSLNGKQVDLDSDSYTYILNGTSYTVDADDIEDRVPNEFQSWMVGLQWRDVFIEGNDLGFAVGQPQFVTSLKGGDTPFDGNYAWELWYQFQVTDNIAITPALFYLSRPQGNLTGPTYDNNFSVFGGLVQTTFKF